jgi:hypothetical protein
MLKTTTAVLAALLAQASLQPVQANDALHHWLNVCQEPQLAYWQELCARSREAHPNPPSIQPTTALPQKQKAAEGQAAHRGDAGKN